MNATPFPDPMPSPDLSPGELLSNVEAFLLRHEMADTRFGRDVTDDPNLVDSLRGGREPRRAMRIKIVSYMAAKDAERGAVSDHVSDDTGDDRTQSPDIGRDRIGCTATEVSL